MSFTSILNWILSHLPYPKNDLTAFFTKGCSWVEVYAHNNSLRMWHMKESYPPYYSKSGALPDRSGKRSYLKAPAPSSPVVTNSPLPQHNRGHQMAKQTCQPVFSTNWNIATMIFTAERHEGWSCFGFCFRPLEPHKMTHITVSRAESLQKGGLPENSKLYWVWDLSYIPWCFGIVWFHHLSPTLPNFYQTRQEAGTLYSVCTVALSKTSLFSFFANVSGKGINMLCAKWITAN